ncbi:MAG: ATP-dependent Clp protease ATP-binding subunit [Treponema sp.]|nr:ATP-dependent Clp protease ATP-binding subunit [Treponema sp.]
MNELSPRARRLINVLAQAEGRKSGSEQLQPEHVLLALLKSADGLGYAVLQFLRINVLTYQLSLEQSITTATPVESIGDLFVSRRLRTLLDIAAVESRSLSNGYIGTEHLLLAAIREEKSLSALYFEHAEIPVDTVRSAIKEVQSKMATSFAGVRQQLNAPGMFQSLYPGQEFERRRQTGPVQKSFLSEYSRNLNTLALEEKIDPVVGRESEIQRVIQILSRRTKNNPVLIGEPGVGKTAIIEGLAQRIVQGKVPRILAKKNIVCLDLAALIAGTKYRGEFEERMKKMMKEVNDSKNIILFIDEMHTIIGAGGPEGTMDASNILKPALSRGEIQIIGATTTKEYRKYVEKDPALERRFQIVKVEEPSVADTEKILLGLKKKYEDFHCVSYADSVIPLIVKLAHRYIPERYLPDKAIDILDETGAAKKIVDDTIPMELADLEKNIEALSQEKKLLVQNQDYEKAALVRDKVIDMKKKLEAYKEYWSDSAVTTRKLVTDDDVCAVISKMTGIPLEHIDDSETRKLLHMENEIHKSVIGQNEAIKIISSAIRRSRTGVSSGARPLGSFIFLGPTGVGKTQLAKILARFLFGNEDSLIRIDMSDYMEKHNASRLVGAPPGYIGYDQGGVLTEQVRQHPYSVVLLDEIEKAHADVFNLLLQLLEEGELSDNFGHMVNFRNTVIIMTSNAGARKITNDSKVGFTPAANQLMTHAEIQADAINELKHIMNPELLNRIDDIVVFDALNQDEVAAILDIQLKELEQRLSEHNFSLRLQKSAKDFFIEHGYDPSMGARPMRRLIQKELEDPLSLLILEGRIGEGDTVVASVKNGVLSLRVQRCKKVSVSEPVVERVSGAM